MTGVVDVCLWCSRCSELTRDGCADRSFRRADDISSIASDDQSRLSLIMVKPNSVLSTEPLSPETGDCASVLIFSNNNNSNSNNNSTN